MIHTEHLVQYRPEFDQLSGKDQHWLPRTLASVQKFVESSAQINRTNYVTRDAHAKTFGVFKGTFIKESVLPDFISEIFKDNETAVWLRLSHASPVISRSKSESPAYGFALKFENIQGSEANFPLANFPVFPVKSVHDFLKFFHSLNVFLYTKQDNVLVSVMDIPFLVKHFARLLPGMLSWDALRNIKKILNKKKDFILSFDFYSIGVFRMGSYLMKLQAEPESPMPRYAHTLSQKDRIENYVKNHDINFILKAQFCADEKKQPINDLSVEWKDAPSVILGKLTFKQLGMQDITDGQTENIGFNPFENCGALLPVGKMQQIRKSIYETSIETRRNLNHAAFKV